VILAAVAVVLLVLLTAFALTVNLATDAICSRASATATSSGRVSDPRFLFFVVGAAVAFVVSG